MTNPNGWGVPDWRELGEYPSPTGRARMLVWAWEFLRRNPEYRAFWSKKAAKLIHPDGYIIEPFHEAVKEAEERFGTCIFPTNPSSKKPEKFRPTSIHMIRPTSDRQPFSINLKDHEIGYLFDLTLPLEG